VVQIPEFESDFMFFKNYPNPSSSLLLALSVLLVACGGGGGGSGSGPLTSDTLVSQTAPSGPMASDAPVLIASPASGAVILKAPVLFFNDTGISVTDGITNNGRWWVESVGIDWEFSLDKGVTWKRGSGTTFDVKGDGAKMIWVRARDDLGNTSEIVYVNCVLDTMAPASVAITGVAEGSTNILKLAGIEPGAKWEYSFNEQRIWLPGTGNGLGILGNNLSRVWLRQIDMAGNISVDQAFDLKTPNMLLHEASSDPLQPSVLSLNLFTFLIHGEVVRGDADYVRWDIPKGQQLVSVRLVQYVSEDAISFYALQPNKVFDAGVNVTRMLVYGHMGPSDLTRNVLASVPKSQLGEGAMTLWFQQTGLKPTQYAIEVVLASAD
jgi:hypothetical protein